MSLKHSYTLIAPVYDAIIRQLVEKVPRLHVVKDKPALLGGWFRLIELEKRAA